MKVTLVALPPMGDRVADRLRKYDGVELDHVRDTRHKTTIPQGTRFVLVMNTGALSPLLKKEAEQVGATYLPIPPSWSHAEMRLAEHHFFDQLRQELAATANPERRPLTHRPLEGVKEVVAPDQQIAAPTKPEVIRGPGSIREARAARRCELAEVERVLRDVDGRVARMTAEEGYSAYAQVRGAEGSPRIVGRPLFEQARRKAREELGVQRYVSQRERLKWAADYAAQQAEVPTMTKVLTAMREEFGEGCETGFITAVVRREMTRRSREKQPTPAVVVVPDGAQRGPQPLTPAPLSGSLPSPVAAAERALVEALRSAGLASYVLTYVGGEAEREYEVAVKTRTKL